MYGFIINLSEITRKPDYNTSHKHNHLLEIIVDNYTPKMIKARRCSGQRSEIEKHFNDLLQRGVVIRGSAEVCASPITCAQKKDKSLRVCVDYTRLNSYTRSLSYHLLNIDEL